MDKENVVYIQNGVLLNIKNESMSIARKWMEVETTKLSEISHTEKDKY
jgi:hypothetical protein